MANIVDRHPYGRVRQTARQTAIIARMYRRIHLPRRSWYADLGSLVWVVVRARLDLWLAVGSVRGTGTLPRRRSSTETDQGDGFARVIR